MIALISTGRHDLSYLKPIANCLQNKDIWEFSVTQSENEYEFAYKSMKSSGFFAGCMEVNEKPKAIVVVGDRPEVLAICTAATILKIPIAHVHGGEQTLGAIDNKCRHAISQLATWHFCANQDALLRLTNMSVPGQIYCTGSPAMDLMFQKNRKRIPSNQIVLLYHPTTLGELSPLEEISEVVQGVELALEEHQTVLMIGANPDAGGSTIDHYLCTIKHERWSFQKSFTSEEYWDILASCYCLVGNSSSGIIEAPALGVPSINIGIRQQGRLQAQSTTNVPVDALAIRDAILAVKQPPEPYFPYGKPGASRMIADVLTRAVTC